MTTRSNDVSVTITGKDRLSPVLQNAKKNMGRMQSSVVQMTGSMGALSSATTGILGPMGGLVGTMGVLGLAVTGVGLGLSLGINKFKAWREEQKKVSQATENLRNRLMLSGFSASAATSSVDELRGSLGRLAFQALPGLDFEMQGFIVNMDDATRSRFDEYVQNLIDLGVPASQALSAIGEALQGNFGPITQLMKRPITSFGEFTEAMLGVKTNVVASSEPIVTALQRIADGTVPVEEGVKELVTEIAADISRAAQVFSENADIVQGLLGQMTEAEQKYVVDNALNFGLIGVGITQFQHAYRDELESIKRNLFLARRVERAHTQELRDEIDGRIAHIQRIDPAMAEEFQKVADRNAEDPWALAELKRQLLVFIQEVTAEATGLVGFLDSAATRARNRLDSLGSYAAAARAASNLKVFVAESDARASARIGEVRRQVQNMQGRASPRPLPVVGLGGVPRPVPTKFRQHGAIVTRPEVARIGEVPEIVAPLSRLPSLLGAMGDSRPIHITFLLDGQVWRRFVIDALNDEVSLREPSLGLG